MQQSNLVYVGKTLPHGRCHTFYDKFTDTLINYPWMAYYKNISQNIYMTSSDGCVANQDTRDYYDDQLAILQAIPIYEIAALTVILPDLLPKIEYYLRSIYPCRRKFIPVGYDNLFDNFDTTNMVECQINDEQAFRGIYHNNEELIVICRVFESYKQSGNEYVPYLRRSWFVCCENRSIILSNVHRKILNKKYKSITK
jgi:hypothetical protein